MDIEMFIQMVQHLTNCIIQAHTIMESKAHENDTETMKSFKSMAADIQVRIEALKAISNLLVTTSGIPTFETHEELVNAVELIDKDAARFITDYKSQTHEFAAACTLPNCFDFNTTPQGADYWGSIYTKLLGIGDENVQAS